MAEVLTLATVETKPAIATWKVVQVWLDIEGPAIKVTFEANTGERRVWRLIPDASTTAETIRADLSFVNRGKFKTAQDKTLQRWLIEQWLVHGGSAGVVTGTVD